MQNASLGTVPSDALPDIGKDLTGLMMALLPAISAAIAKGTKGILPFVPFALHALCGEASDAFGKRHDGKAGRVAHRAR